MFVTLKFDGAAIGAVYSSLGIAAVLMPTLLGIVADKWISAKWVYAACHLVGALTLYLAAQVTTPGEMFLVILLNSLAYMPTLGLINTISYYRLQSAGLDIVTDFPPIRIWGTIGFIFAMWGVSFSGFELSHMQLYIGATLSVLLTLFTLTLPTIPVANAQRNQSWTEMLGLNAFALFKNKRMAIFFIFSMMLGAELQITNMFGNTFLHSFDKDPLFAGSFIVEHASVLMSISQISETLFILTIPFFLSRYGIKNVMLISIVAWMLRFGLFAFGDPTPFGTVLLVLSMIVYGCAFDFFNISGSVFVEKEVRPEIRASAQGMFLMMTNGFGCILGGMVSGKVVEHFTVEGITNWQSVWLIFAGYSLVLALPSWRCSNTNTSDNRPPRSRARDRQSKTPRRFSGAFFILQHVAIQPLNAVRIRLAVYPLQLRREARQHIDPLLQREEIAQYSAAPDLTGHHAQHARRIRQRPFRRDAASASLRRTSSTSPRINSRLASWDSSPPAGSSVYGTSLFAGSSRQS
jgi:NHS family nucleoside permease-like MFS transporter